MLGKTISHYRILEKLGEGGMGVVYKAEDTKLHRQVALKFLPIASAADQESNTRLLREAQAAAALDHPNVCTVFEIDRVEEHTFIAMALIEGRTLKDRIAGAPLPLDEALDIAVQAAEGLNHAHQKDIVHRDIKPANLMLTADGQLKILDFGLSRSVGQTRLTVAGTTLGTVGYMSPEQSRGELADSRSDIWSLGVVLFEMIAGRLPFVGEHDQALIYAIRNQEPDPLTGLRTGVPIDLERTVTKCLAKDPAERYQTAADLLADLRRLKRTSEVATLVTPITSTIHPATQPRRRWPGFVALAIIALIAGFFISRLFLPSARAPEGRKMLAVLPLENLGPAEDEYFADGLTEEITSRLAGLAGLGVISRTSAMRYKSDRPTLKQIGSELGVDYVLEGTVRWEHREDGTSRVLVTPQLIRVADDTHLWADRYMRDLSEIFAVQADIAREVARELNVTLLESEQAALELRPTDSPQAYEAYLRGLEALKEPNSRAEDFTLAQHEFERAIELDPDFTMAYTRLAAAHGEMVFWGFDRSEARVALAKEAIDQALALEPHLPEVHRELGSYYYMVHDDYDRALAEFAIAERGLPNDPELMESVAYIWRRQDKFEEAIGHLLRAAGLDPRNAWLRMQIGLSYSMIREYPKADPFYAESIALEPDQIISYAFRSMNYGFWNGDLEQARNVIATAPNQQAPEIAASWYNVEMWARRYQEALRRLAILPDGYAGSAWFFNKELMAGQAYHAMGEHDQAVAQFAAAIPVLEQKIREQPRVAPFHSAMGEAYAGLGRTEEALREGREGIRLHRHDAMQLASRYEDMARIHGLLGEYDEAIAALDTALSMPGLVSVQMLRLSSGADPLRGHPGFQELIEKYSGK